MHQIQLQLTDLLFDEAQRRSAVAGFANLDEYIVDVIVEDLMAETENLDRCFSPQVIPQLNSIRADIHEGDKTCTQLEVDQYVREKANIWRDSHPD